MQYDDDDDELYFIVSIEKCQLSLRILWQKQLILSLF